MLKLCFVFCIGVLCGACGDYNNNPLVDDLKEQDAQFLNALPSKAALEMRLAENQPRCDDCRQGALAIQARALGDTAEYLSFAVDLTTAYNKSIFDFLGMVDWITQLIPPSYREHDRRDWGPFRSDENQAVEVRFVMRKKAQTPQAEYHLFYQMRWFNPEQARDEAWQDCVFGQVLPVIGLRRGQGQLTISLDNCSEFENKGEQGVAVVDYDTAPDDLNPTGKTQLKIEFTNFLSKQEAEDDETPLNALYDYAEASDYSGRFRFLGLKDIVPGSNPIVPQPEQYDLVVAWNTQRAGGATLTLSKGDLGDLSIRVFECWDESLSRVYYLESHVPGSEQGDPNDCVEL